MISSLQKLDWDKLLNYLSKYLSSEKAKEEVKSFSPPFDFKKANLLQKETQFISELFKNKIEFSFPELNSIEKLFLKQKKRGFFLVAEIIRFKPWFTVLKTISPYLTNSPFFKIKELFDEIAFLEERLEEIVDIKNATIKDNASFQLYIIRKRLKELKEILWKKLEFIKEKLYKKGYLREPIITQRAERYVLPVKIEYKGKVKGILHEVSSSGATAFIEPVEIISLTNDLEELKWQEEREIVKILRYLSEEFGNFEKEFLELEKEFVRFELALARAEFGRKYNGVFPELKSGEIYFKKAIHPLLYLAYKENKISKIVYNDLIVKKGLLISGPNLGGKTVALKTIGLLSLMAQAGFPLPIEEGRVPVFEKLFIDLGDEQDLFEGESSFSAHLRNLKQILQLANENSLVLLDEPGKGTNPEEGSALIAGVISVLLEKNCKIVVTTHSQELKMFALKIPEMELASMEYNTKNFEPLYKLVYGKWGESFAFELAKKIGIEERALKIAEEFLQNKEYWRLTKILEKEREALKEKEALLRNLEKTLKEKEKQLKKRETALENQKKKELEALIQEYKDKLEKLLISSNILKTSERKIKEKFSKTVSELIDKAFISKKESDVSLLKEGDIVFIPSIGQEGKVIKIKGNLCEVLIGTLKLEIEKKKLQKIKKGKEKSEQNFKEKIKFDLDKVLEKEEEEVDLRGLFVDEAISKLEQVLNQAFLNMKKKLIIIHGHGTGKLKEAVREYLKGHPLIERFEDAPLNKGGSGATVVYLAKLM